MILKFEKTIPISRPPPEQTTACGDLVSRFCCRRDSASLVILLHGLGASGAQMAPIAADWRSRWPDAKFATPDAPYRNSYGGHQWFKVDGLQLDPARIREAREAFDKAVHAVVVQEGFESRLKRVALVGVSQGAIVSMDAVASGRWNVGALVAFSGLLPPISISPISNSTPVLMVHGADDRTIPSVASTVAAAQLRAAGFQVELDIERGVGHTISLTGASRTVEFLRRTLA